MSYPPWGNHPTKLLQTCMWMVLIKLEVWVGVKATGYCTKLDLEAGSDYSISTY